MYFITYWGRYFVKKCSSSNGTFKKTDDYGKLIQVVGDY